MEATRIKFYPTQHLVNGLSESRLLGCVDGVLEGELRGWIVNLDRPGRMEYVTCRGANGHTSTFCPLTLRPDVNEALGIEGVFGFAIPLDLLTPLGHTITVTDQDGGVLSHGDAVALAGEPTALPDDRINVFLHISKTAGTSLRNTLLRTVPQGEQVLIYPGATPGITVDRFHQIPLHQRNRLRWLFGHQKFGLDRFVTRESRYITFIRDPEDRLRSNFAHHAAAGTIFEIDGDRMLAATVINEGLSEEFDNVMTRVIAGLGQQDVPLGSMGDDEVELALCNVRRHFAFVGCHSNLAEDTRTLQAHLKLAIDPLTVDNVTPSEMRYHEREMASVDWPRVMARNTADIRLCARLAQENLVSRLL